MLVLWLISPAYATWSLVAVDPDTGEVGIAGATCGPFVWGIAGVAPGHGVVAAQYVTWVGGKNDAVDALEAGSTPAEVLETLTTEDNKPELRQWAVLSLDQPPATFGGAEVEDAAIVSGDTWSVQGNTLASDAVVDEAAAALQAEEGDLAHRLLAGLVAGASEGGDHRCDPEVAAKSAFLYVAMPDDSRHEPTVEVRAAGSGAVGELAEKFAAGAHSCSTTGAPSGVVSIAVALALLVRRRVRPAPVPLGLEPGVLD